MNVLVQKLRTVAITVDLPQVKVYAGSVFLVALCLAWVLPGTYGHEPWGAHEPVSIGLTAEMISTGDWTVPAIAGDPYLAAFPLLPMSAAIFAEFFDFLPLHEILRLVCALYSLVALLFLWLASRELIGERKAAAAIVIALGTLGLQDASDTLMAGPVIMSGLAMALYGLSTLRRREIFGGFWLGTGAGITFLAGSILVPLALVLACALLPLVGSPWRSKRFAEAAGFAATFAIPWFVIWPLSLWLRSDAFFGEWFRFAMANLTNVKDWHPTGSIISMAWCTFPALPLAAWGVWKKRGRLRRCGSVLSAAILCAVGIALVALAPGGKSLILPMLLPLAIIAAAGMDEFPENSLPWVNGTLIGIFALSAALLWLGWGVLLTGYPQSLAGHLLGIRPTYSPEFTPAFFWAAIFYTAVWLAVLIMAGKTQFSLLLRWSSGILLLWGLLMTLWLPWIDAGYSYRTVFHSFADGVEDRSRCVSSQGLTPIHRALLYYYGDLKTEAVEGRPPLQCDLMIVQGPGDLSPGKEWVKVLEGGRPRYDEERFSLWSRERNGVAVEEQVAKPQVKEKKRRVERRTTIKRASVVQEQVETQTESTSATEQQVEPEAEE